MIFTRHFSYEEFIRSEAAARAGIGNELPPELKTSAQFTLAGMERVRAALKSLPVKILSGYRGPEVNRLVGGSSSSQHMKAEAVDFVCPEFGTPLETAKFLAPLCWVIGIDQMILEPTWVHVSFTSNPRGQVLHFVDGKYKVGLA